MKFHSVTILATLFLAGIVVHETQCQRLLGLMATAGLMRAFRGGQNKESESPLNQNPEPSLGGGSYGGSLGNSGFHPGLSQGFGGFGGFGGGYGGQNPMGAFGPGGYAAASYGVPTAVQGPAGFGGQQGPQGFAGGYQQGPVQFATNDDSFNGNQYGGQGGSSAFSSGNGGQVGYAQNGGYP